jgi:hypothetical protein|tara:strand:- start:993 stop:1190 length:198 start_codon:yes stop_codon:yes gene_type:complete
MSDDDKEFRYTSYPSGLPKTYTEEDEVKSEEINQGVIKILLNRISWKISATLLLLMVIGTAWIVR